MKIRGKKNLTNLSARSPSTKKKESFRRNRNRIVQKKSYHPECPVSVESHFQVLTFQIFTVSSQLPLATDTPSGLQTTDATLRFGEMSQHAKQLDKRRKLDKTEKKKSYGSECPLNVDTHSRVIKFQILTDLSSLQLASLKPSGLKQTPLTSSECPFRVDFTSPVTVS